MLPFAFTIFAGAFLLFAVQPLIGKFILPWFGGGPGVWATCLLFFQMLLLGGYAYAHFTTSRLTPRRQAFVHLGLLALSLLVLPIIPDARWKPQGGDDPVWGILLLLTVTLGLPYFVLSSTGPLMQQWSSRALNGQSPYRLYALSNAGSLLALLGYPFYFERVFSRQAQAGWWSAGFIVFALGCGWCAWRVVRNADPTSPAAEPTREESNATRPAASDRLLWFALAGAASILLMATTNKLCQDLAVIPFLWVLPLSLYLISFILCFDHPRWYSRTFFSGLFVLGALVDCYLLFAGHSARLVPQVVGYSTTLFAACMLCHGELYHLRPTPKYLTSFYLSIAAGGAAGGVLVALLAPLVFNRFLELHIGLWLLSYLLGAICFRQRSSALVYGAAAGALLGTIVWPALKTLEENTDTPFTTFWLKLQQFYGENWYLIAAFLVVLGGVALRKHGQVHHEWRQRMVTFPMMISLGLGILLVFHVHEDEKRVVSTSRNFYGVLKVFEHSADDPKSHYYSLVHGVTAHGLQFANLPQAAWATTYYGDRSGVGLAINHTPEGNGRKIGLVGLGTGTLAIHGRAKDTMRIYEIDPDVERLARTRFTYLALSPANVDVVLGDARLSMERELEKGERQNFDVLALDAFSSDAIPVHLLTAEAFKTYLDHLKPDGVIAVHVSNRYLDLQPVVENAARHFGLEIAVISDDENEDWWVYRTTWILLTKNKALLEVPEIAAVTTVPEPAPTEGAAIDNSPGKKKRKRPVPLWTDDHASLIEVLK